MNYKLKKPLIIAFSGIILFVGVFFMTRSIAHLVDTSNNANVNSKNEAASKTTANNPIEDNSKSSKANVENENSQKTTDNTNTTNQPSTSEKNLTEYTVKSGDTLSGIAQKLIPWNSKKQAVKTLIEINSLKNPEILPVGSRLLIPENPIDTSGCIEHKVTKGETLYKIATKYFPGANTNKSIKIIMEKNNISDPKFVSEDMLIYIPKNDTPTSNNSNED